MIYRMTYGSLRGLVLKFSVFKLWNLRPETAETSPSYFREGVIKGQFTKNTSFLPPVVLFIHLDSLGVSWQVFEIAIEMSALSGL